PMSNRSQALAAATQIEACSRKEMMLQTINGGAASPGTVSDAAEVRKVSQQQRQQRRGRPALRLLALAVALLLLLLLLRALRVRLHGLYGLRMHLRAHLAQQRVLARLLQELEVLAHAPFCL